MAFPLTTSQITTASQTYRLNATWTAASDTQQIQAVRSAEGLWGALNWRTSPWTSDVAARDLTLLLLTHAARLLDVSEVIWFDDILNQIETSAHFIPAVSSLDGDTSSTAISTQGATVPELVTGDSDTQRTISASVFHDAVRAIAPPAGVFIARSFPSFTQLDNDFGTAPNTSGDLIILGNFFGSTYSQLGEVYVLADTDGQLTNLGFRLAASPTAKSIFDVNRNRRGIRASDIQSIPSGSYFALFKRQVAGSDPAEYVWFAKYRLNITDVPQNVVDASVARAVQPFARAGDVSVIPDAKIPTVIRAVDSIPEVGGDLNEVVFNRTDNQFYKYSEEKTVTVNLVKGEDQRAGQDDTGFWRLADPSPYGSLNQNWIDALYFDDDDLQLEMRFRSGKNPGDIRVTFPVFGYVDIRNEGRTGYVAAGANRFQYAGNSATDPFGRTATGATVVVTLAATSRGGGFRFWQQIDVSQLQAQVDARIRTQVHDWAESDNSDDIPEDKLPYGTSDWAQTGNTDNIPAAKLADSPNQALAWASVGNTDDIPEDKLDNARFRGFYTNDPPTAGFSEGAIILVENEGFKQLQLVNGVLTWQVIHSGGGGGGGLDTSQVTALVQSGVADWAEAGNTDDIPESKIPAAAVTSKVADWAQEGNVDTMPDAKASNSIARTTQIPQPSTDTPQQSGTGAAGTSTKYAREDHVHPSSGGLDEGEVDARVQHGVSDWAEEGNTDAIPASKLTNAPTAQGLNLPAVQQAARAQIADWAETDNTDQIPDDKIPPTPSGTVFPNVPRGSEFVLTSRYDAPNDETVTITGPQPGVYIIPFGSSAPANGPFQIVAYVDTNPNALLRGRVFVQTRGTGSIRANRIPLYAPGSERKLFTVSRTAVSSGFGHFYEVAGVDYATIGGFYEARNTGHVLTNVEYTSLQVPSDPLSNWLYRPTRYEPGNYIRAADGSDPLWVLNPLTPAAWARFGQPEPRTLFAITNLIDGPFTGQGITNSSNTRRSNLHRFTPAFDIDDEDKQSGTILMSALLRLMSRSDDAIAFDTTGTQSATPQLRINDFVFVSDVREADAWSSTADGGVEVAQATIYRGSTTLGTIGLWIAKDAANQLGYYWNYKGASGSYSWSLAGTMEGVFEHNDGPAAQAAAWAREGNTDEIPEAKIPEILGTKLAANQRVPTPVAGNYLRWNPTTLLLENVAAPTSAAPWAANTGRSGRAPLDALPQNIPGTALATNQRLPTPSADKFLGWGSGATAGTVVNKDAPTGGGGSGRTWSSSVNSGSTFDSDSGSLTLYRITSSSRSQVATKTTGLSAPGIRSGITLAFSFPVGSVNTDIYEFVLDDPDESGNRFSLTFVKGVYDASPNLGTLASQVYNSTHLFSFNVVTIQIQRVILRKVSTGVQCRVVSETLIGR